MTRSSGRASQSVAASPTIRFSRVTIPFSNPFARTRDSRHSWLICARDGKPSWSGNEACREALTRRQILRRAQLLREPHLSGVAQFPETHEKVGLRHATPLLTREVGDDRPAVHHDRPIAEADRMLH